MSKSNPPRSSIVERVRHSSTPVGQFVAHHRSWRRRVSIRFAALMLWLHIYLSMFGLAAVLFFSITGLTLNHPDWFAGAERSVEAEGRVAPEWLHRGAATPAGSAEEPDPTTQVAKL